MDKEKVHSIVSREIKRRVDQLAELLEDAQTATTGETKSSAGDKHETSRAMAHLEQEKLGGQLAELNKLKEVIFLIDPTKKHTSIQLGSLVETTNGWFYISVGIGAINFENTTIFCMTPAAPLGKFLLGKKIGDQINWQGKKINITNLI